VDLFSTLLHSRRLEFAAHPSFNRGAFDRDGARSKNISPIPSSVHEPVNDENPSIYRSRSQSQCQGVWKRGKDKAWGTAYLRSKRAGVQLEEWEASKTIGGLVFVFDNARSDEIPGGQA
jgi:hypothetical protein